MTRLVQAADGRTWTLERELNWVTPAIGDDFEHDVAPGYTSLTLLSLALGLLLVVLIAWTPDPVVIPAWLVLIVVVALLAIPVRWMLRRPWTVVAEVQASEFDERPGERWVGTVRGALSSRTAMVKAAEHIQVRNEPSLDGPLQPVE